MSIYFNLNINKIRYYSLCWKKIRLFAFGKEGKLLC